MGHLRGEEISRRNDKHTNEIGQYVIIDDSDMLEGQLNNFIQTYGFYRLSDRTASLAIDILENRFIPNRMRINMGLFLRHRQQISNNNK